MTGKRLGLLCVAPLICFPLFSQKLELIKTIDTTSSLFEYTTDISEYLPVVSERNSIVRLEPTAKVILQQEDHYIWSADYNRDNGKVVYTFGSADAANIAIFDTASKKRILLGTEIIRQIKEFKIVSFGDAHWIDSDSIVFVTVATDFQKRLIKYTLHSRGLLKLAEAKEIDKVSVNRTSGIVVYVSITGNIQDNHFLSIATGMDKVFSQEKYSSIIPLSDHDFLATTHESKVIFSKFDDSSDTEVNSAMDEINAILDYDERTHKLIAWTNRSLGTIQYSIYYVDLHGI